MASSSRAGPSNASFPMTDADIAEFDQAYGDTVDISDIEEELRDEAADNLSPLKKRPSPIKRRKRVSFNAEPVQDLTCDSDNDSNYSDEMTAGSGDEEFSDSDGDGVKKGNDNDEVLIDVDGEDEDDEANQVPLDVQTESLKRSSMLISITSGFNFIVNEAVKYRRPQKQETMTIDALLGQAAVLTAHNQTEEAIELLQTIIASNPQRSEPYLQLAEIYENRDDDATFFEYRLYGCIIDSKTSADTWDYTGDLAMKLSKPNVAVACYKRAYRAGPTDWTYYQKAINLLENLGYVRLAMLARLKACETVEISDDVSLRDWLNEAIEQVTEYFYDESSDSRSIPILRIRVQRSKEFGQYYADFHQKLVQIFVRNQLWTEVIKSILGIQSELIRGVTSTGVLAYEVTKSFSIVPFPPYGIKTLEIDDGFPMLRILQLACAFAGMGWPDIVEQLTAKIMADKFVEEHMDLYTVLLNTMDEGKMSDQVIDFVAWLQQEGGIVDTRLCYLTGLAHERKGDNETALHFYREAVKVDTNNVDARVNISLILDAQGDIDGALAILEQFNLDGCKRLPAEKLLLQQLNIFCKEHFYEQYVRTIRMLLIPHFYYVVRHSQEILCTRRTVKVPTTVSLRRWAYRAIDETPLKKLVRHLGAISERDGRKTDLLQPDDLYELVLKLTHVLFDLQRFHELVHVLCFAVLHPHVPHKDKMQSLLLMATFHAGYYRLAIFILRCKMTDISSNTSIERPEKIRLLNKVFHALNYSSVHIRDIRLQKAQTRLLTKFGDNHGLILQVASHSIAAGSNKYAIYLLFKAMKLRPNNACTYMLISVCFTNLCTRRSISNRCPMTTRAVGFMMRYAKLRLDEGVGLRQEVYFNLGRMLHQMGLLTEATHWYDRVLNTEDPIVECVNDEISGVMPQGAYSLKTTAALNYIQVVRKCNPLLAQWLRKTYCVLR